MRKGLINEIREALLDEMGVDVRDFEYIGTDGLQVAVAADGEVFVLEFDQYWEEAHIVSQYPLSMRRKAMWEAV